jgi:hypothetical protein
MRRIRDVYGEAGLNGPFLIGMMLRTRSALKRITSDIVPGSSKQAGLVQPGDYPFPIVQADNIIDTDRIMQPLCDQAQQMFGIVSSPNCDDKGAWTGSHFVWGV